MSSIFDRASNFSAPLNIANEEPLSQERRELVTFQQEITKLKNAIAEFEDKFRDRLINLSKYDPRRMLSLLAQAGRNAIEMSAEELNPALSNSNPALAQALAKEEVLNGIDTAKYALAQLETDFSRAESEHTSLISFCENLDTFAYYLNDSLNKQINNQNMDDDLRRSKIETETAHIDYNINYLMAKLVLIIDKYIEPILSEQLKTRRLKSKRNENDEDEDEDEIATQKLMPNPGNRMKKLLEVYAQIICSVNSPTTLLNFLKDLTNLFFEGSHEQRNS